ncbi:MAG: type II toxin-antitoxin system Phd/YefM family antitoxin [Geodermatophilaceae bacterium]
MTTTGLRELRQQASELVRRAEAGETVTVTVSGRAVAQLIPMTRNRWRNWREISSVFSGPTDLQWTADRELLDDAPRDPWVS